MTEIGKKDIPSIDIRIDKDGIWYYEGNEMFRKDILSTFFQELDRDAAGRYVIRHNEQTFSIEVEDVPFAVKSVELSSDEQGGAAFFNILLTDDSVEKLDPATLRMEKDNVLWTEGLGIRVRNQRLVWNSVELHVAWNQGVGHFDSMKFELSAKVPLKMLDFKGTRPQPYAFK